MSKPVLIMDQHFRRVEELFSPEVFGALEALCHIEGARNWPMPEERIAEALNDAQFLVASRPNLTSADLARAPNLRAVIEVSGAFHTGLDYNACFARGIEVLSCAPGFRMAVAEMGLAMILAGARGLVAEHENFRRGAEQWLDDREGLDFTLHKQRVGFVGYGNISRELHRLMSPLAPVVSAYDPWVKTLPDTVRRCDLHDLFQSNRVVVVTAVPTADNHHMIDGNLIDAMPPGALLVVLSRAHVLDFDAALAAAQSGRITLATDVFPSEPVLRDDPMRQTTNVILSPHRAAAVEGGRHPIGEMILHDVSAILRGVVDRQLLPANPDRVTALIEAQQQIEKAGRLAKT